MSDHTLSGDTSKSTEFKAGHAPAIRVGGMRVGASRPRQTSQGDDKDKNMNSEERAVDNESGERNNGETGNNNQRNIENEDIEQELGVVTNHVAGQMVSGTFVPVQKAFPTEAVKHIHEKPGTYPRHEYHHHGRHDEQRFINQPRKQ